MEEEYIKKIARGEIEVRETNNMGWCEEVRSARGCMRDR